MIHSQPPVRCVCHTQKRGGRGKKGGRGGGGGGAEGLGSEWTMASADDVEAGVYGDDSIPRAAFYEGGDGMGDMPGDDGLDDMDPAELAQMMQVCQAMHTVAA